MSERTLIVGDIHGCLEELIELLHKVNFQKDKERLILAGDLISKGPYPFEVISFVRRHLKCEVVMGNHERALLFYLQGKKYPYKGFKELQEKMAPDMIRWIRWLENLPLYIETQDFLVVHAGLQPKRHPKDTDPRILTTIRTWDGKGEVLNNTYAVPWFDLYKGEKLVVFGHWAQLGLLVRDNVIGLDSGCVYGNTLSALILPERDIVQVKAKKVYQIVQS